MAEAATMEVRARLSAETAQFTKGMENARRSADELTQASNRLRGAVVGVGVVAGTATAAIIGFGIKAFNAAARVDELNIALNAVGKSTGYGYQKLNETALAIKSMGIEMEIAQKATLKYAQNNLELAKASEVARVAQDLAVIGAMNSSDAFDRLTHAIITGRSEVLKSVGIQKSAGAAYAEYGASIGKAAKDLTATEKQTAVLNLVLKEGARVAGTYEAAMTTPGKVLRSFARLHNDLAVSIGSVLVSGFGPLIFETYELYKQFTKAVAGTGAFKDILEALEMVLVKLATPITAFIKGLGSMIEKMNKAEISTKGLAEAIEFLLPVFAALGSAAAVVAGKQIFALVPILGSVMSKLRPLPIALLAMTLTSTQVRNAMVKLLDALRPVINPLMQLGKIMAGVAAIGVSILAKGIEGLASLVRGTISLIQKYAGVFKVLGTVIGALALGYAAYRLTIIATTVATQIWAKATVAATTITTAFQKAQLLLNATIAFNPIPLLIGAMVALVVAFAAAWKNSETFREVMTNVFNTVGNVVGKVLGFFFKAFGNLLVAFGNLIDANKTFGEVVASVIQFVYEAYLTWYKFVIGAVKSVLDAFLLLFANQTLFAQVVATVLNFVVSAFAKTIAFIIGVVKSWVDTFISLMESNETLRKIIETVFNTIIAIIGHAVTSIVVVLANIIKAIATIVYYFAKFKDFVGEVWGKIVLAIDKAKDFIGKILGTLGSIMSGVISFMREKFASFINWLADKADKIPKVLGGDAIRDALKGIAKAVAGVDKSQQDFKPSLGEDISKTVATAISGIGKLDAKIIEASESWGNYKYGAAGALSGVANLMLKFASKVTAFSTKDNGQKLVEGFVGDSKKVSNTLAIAIKGLKTLEAMKFGDKVVEGLVKTAEKASDGLGKVLSGLEKVKKLDIGKFVVEKTSQAAIDAGNFMIGLATSIESFTNQEFVKNVGDAFEGLMDSLKEGLGFGDVLAKEKKAFEESGANDTILKDVAEDLEGQADYMKRIREAMADGIKGIKNVIQDLADAAKDFADSLKDVIVNFAGLKGVELPDGFIPKAKSLIENMRMRLDKSQQFANQIGLLQGMNLNAESLKAIIEEGPIKGAQLAASILGGGSEAIAEINKLQQAISFTGAAVGQYGADVAYKDLITGAQTKLSQIESASMKYGTSGSNVYVSQGAVQITVDTKGAADATEMGDMVVAKIEEIFATLGKELAAK
jgi:phage-related protein